MNFNHIAIACPGLVINNPAGPWQVVTVESSSLIAAVAGGNSTVSAGIDLVLDMTATIDPDEVKTCSVSKESGVMVVCLDRAKTRCFLVSMASWGTEL